MGRVASAHASALIHDRDTVAPLPGMNPPEFRIAQRLSFATLDYAMGSGMKGSLTMGGFPQG
jgi:hypothetical protein